MNKCIVKNCPYLVGETGKCTNYGTLCKNCLHCEIKNLMKKANITTKTTNGSSATHLMSQVFTQSFDLVELDETCEDIIDDYDKSILEARQKMLSAYEDMCKVITEYAQKSMFADINFKKREKLLAIPNDTFLTELDIRLCRIEDILGISRDFYYKEKEKFCKNITEQVNALEKDN